MLTVVESSVLQLGQRPGLILDLHPLVHGGTCDKLLFYL